MTQRRQLMVVTSVFFFIGLGLLATFMVLFLNMREFVHTSKHASGRVVNLEHLSTGNAGDFVTVFAFVDDAGHEHTHRNSFSQHPSPQIGDQITVLYQPDNPDDARIQSFMTLWFVPTLLGALGAGFALVGGFAFISVRRNIPA